MQPQALYFLQLGRSGQGMGCKSQSAHQPCCFNSKEAVNLANEMGFRDWQLSCTPRGYSWGSHKVLLWVPALFCVQHTGKSARGYCIIRTWQAILNIPGNLFNATSTACWIQPKKISWEAEHQTHSQDFKTRRQTPGCKKHPISQK